MTSLILSILMFIASCQSKFYR